MERQRQRKSFACLTMIPSRASEIPHRLVRQLQRRRGAIDDDDPEEGVGSARFDADSEPVRFLLFHFFKIKINLFICGNTIPQYFSLMLFPFFS